MFSYMLSCDRLFFWRGRKKFTASRMMPEFTPRANRFLRTLEFVQASRSHKGLTRRPRHVGARIGFPCDLQEFPFQFVDPVCALRRHAPTMMAAVPPAQCGKQMLGTAAFHPSMFPCSAPRLLDCGFMFTDQSTCVWKNFTQSST